jgi:hypothetical protein
MTSRQVSTLSSDKENNSLAVNPVWTRQASSTSLAKR